MKRYRTVIVNDTHVGSIFGVAPLGFRTQNGTELVAQNPMQEFLWKSWKDFCYFVGKPNEVIYNGDLCDGYCEKTSGIGLWGIDKEDWIEAFIILHQLLVGKKNIPIHVINGSGYHAGSHRGLNLDGEIATRIGANFYRHFLNYEKNSYIFHIQHQTMGISIINPDNMLRRAIDFAEKSQYREVRADYIIRAHAHVYRTLGNENIIGYINGCWQGMTDYMARKSTLIYPSIGGLIVDFFKDEPPHIFFKQYKIPLDVASSLDLETIEKIIKLRKEREQIIAKMERRGYTKDV